MKFSKIKIYIRVKAYRKIKDMLFIFRSSKYD